MKKNFLNPGEWGKTHDKLLIEEGKPVRLPFQQQRRQEYLEILERIAREQFKNSEPIVLPAAPNFGYLTWRWEGPGYKTVASKAGSVPARPWWRFW